MGIWSRGPGRVSQISRSMPTVLSWQHVWGFCAAVTEQLWTHVASERGLWWQEPLTCLFLTPCPLANRKKNVLDLISTQLKFSPKIRSMLVIDETTHNSLSKGPHLYKCWLSLEFQQDIESPCLKDCIKRVSIKICKCTFDCVWMEKKKKRFSICLGETCELSVPVMTSQWADFKSCVHPLKAE